MLKVTGSYSCDVDGCEKEWATGFQINAPLEFDEQHKVIERRWASLKESLSGLFQSDREEMAQKMVLTEDRHLCLACAEKEAVSA
jgi:hypothetical protein